MPNDATFIASPSNPTSANFYEVTLSNPVPPGVATPVVVRYRYAKSSTDGGRTIDLTVELRQGTSVIASATHPNIPGASGSGWQQASLTLTAAQAAAITNGADLRLRIRAITSGGGQGRKAQLSWAETELPPAADPVTSVTYGYDRLSRLTSAADGSGSRSYAYDPVGNRTTRTAGSSTSYTYDRADRLLSAGASPVTVSAVGVTTARGADTFAYDQANRLTQATVAGLTESSAYDGDGVRASRQVGAGPLTRYVTDPAAGLPVTIDDGSRKYVWGLGLAYAVSGTGIEVYHADRLGSVRALTDAAGTVIATYRSDEFGIPLSATGSSTQPFRYTGEPSDASGLNYLRARYYDPSIGRFMSRDPFGGFASSPLTLNRYSYTGNSPVTLTDPSGHCIDPGGPGIRYCIDRFIRDADVFPLDGGGDNRGANANGGTFRTRQLIYQAADGSVMTQEAAGVTHFFGGAYPGFLGACGSAVSTSSRVKGGRSIESTCSASNGFLPGGPEISHLIQIAEDASGHASVTLIQTSEYPAMEVWQYGGPHGPQLIFYYPALEKSVLDLPMVSTLVRPE